MTSCISFPVIYFSFINIFDGCFEGQQRENRQWPLVRQKTTTFFINVSFLSYSYSPKSLNVQPKFLMSHSLNLIFPRSLTIQCSLRNSKAGVLLVIEPQLVRRTNQMLYNWSFQYLSWLYISSVCFEHKNQLV